MGLIFIQYTILSIRFKLLSSYYDGILDLDLYVIDKY